MENDLEIAQLDNLARKNGIKMIPAPKMKGAIIKWYKLELERLGIEWNTLPIYN